MKTIAFDETRNANPGKIIIGVRTDNETETLRFELPALEDDQLAVLYWTNGVYGDVVTLEDGMWTVDKNMTRESGRLECFVRITHSGNVIWNSQPFECYVVAIPAAEESIEKTYPSAIQQGVEEARLAARDAQAAADAARESAAGVVTDEAARQEAEAGRAAAEQGRVDAENERVAAESLRESAEADRVNAENSRAEAESAREISEAARVIAENSRVAAERERVAAEQGRVEAENERVAAFAGYQGEIDGIKDDLANVKNATVTEKYSTNLYNEANAEVGYRCTSGGGKTTDANSVLSEYIAIPDGMTYAVPSAYYNSKYMVFCYTYGFADANKNPIDGKSAVQTAAIGIPDGAKYFRCSWRPTLTAQRFIGFNNDGSLIPYEEYYEPVREVKTSEKVKEKLENHENRISALEHLNNVTPVERVICWGDSLTDGAGASDTKHQYPYVLKSLIDANNTGIVTDSAGQGGEGTYSIATRQGGVVVNVKPCTIPSSGSVNVEVDKWNGLIISLCRRGGNDVTTDNAKMKINPCYIAGVKGTLLRDSNSNYVFTRTEDGEEVTFTRPMPLLTNGHETYNGENEVAVIWSGTNDIASNGGTIEKTIHGINMMIAKLKSKKYIVVGLTSKAYHSDIDDKNFRMATEYKDNFINVRDYMLVYGLEDSSIEPTEQDLTDISNGEIPSSLRVDDVHGNDYFYNIVAKQVYKKGQELGYWN